MNSDNHNNKSLNENHAATAAHDEHNDGFVLVKSKRRKNSTNNKPIIKNKSSSSISSNLQEKLKQIDENAFVDNDEDEELQEVDKEYVFNLNKKILDYKQKLKDYDTCFYWSKMQISLRKILNEYFFSNDVNDHRTKNNKKINLICYGLGSIDNNISSRYQLALFLLIIDEINKYSIMNCSNEKINKSSSSNNTVTAFSTTTTNNKLNIDLVEFYDPVFNQNDKILLTDYFRFKLAAKNEKCLKSTIQTELSSGEQQEDDEKLKENVLNVFYMPHCGKAMYNNLLFSNWSKRSLERLVILGNSFNTITTNNLDNKINTYYSYIRDSLLLIDEIKLVADCDLTNAFTDLSFHVFNRNFLNDQSILNKLVNKLDDETATTTTTNRQAPIYELDSEELF